MKQVTVNYLKFFCTELSYDNMHVLDALQRNKRLFLTVENLELSLRSPLVLKLMMSGNCH